MKNADDNDLKNDLILWHSKILSFNVHSLNKRKSLATFAVIRIILNCFNCVSYK